MEPLSEEGPDEASGSCKDRDEPGWVDAGGAIAYPWRMAVSPVLLEQLMKLDERERVEVAQLLLSTVDARDDEADEADLDDLDEGESARLHAALERSLDDIRAGRVHDAAAVIDELRARHRQ